MCSCSQCSTSFKVRATDLSAAGLLADYTMSWKDISRKVLRYCISDSLPIDTWDG